jgi:hypothetical protein
MLVRISKSFELQNGEQSVCAMLLKPLKTE